MSGPPAGTSVSVRWAAGRSAQARFAAVNDQGRAGQRLKGAKDHREPLAGNGGMDCFALGPIRQGAVHHRTAGQQSWRPRRLQLRPIVQ